MRSRTSVSSWLRFLSGLWYFCGPRGWSWLVVYWHAPTIRRRASLSRLSGKPWCCLEARDRLHSRLLRCWQARSANCLDLLHTDCMSRLLVYSLISVGCGQDFTWWNSSVKASEPFRITYGLSLLKLNHSYSSLRPLAQHSHCGAFGCCCCLLTMWYIYDLGFLYENRACAGCLLSLIGFFSAHLV